MLTDTRTLQNSTKEVRLFSNLVLMVAADEVHVFPAEMVSNHKYAPLPVAREIFRAVMSMHTRWRRIENERTGRKKVRLVLDADEGSPISTTQVGAMLNKDHSTLCKPRTRVASHEQIEHANEVVMSHWPAVKRLGLFAGVTLGKTHAAETAAMSGLGD